MAREMLPGLIKPLIWSVNIPLVNGAWVRILTELIGPNTLDPRRSRGSSITGRTSTSVRSGRSSQASACLARAWRC